MSNYLVAPVNSKYEIWAGWDPMLNSYFAHVINITREEDEPGRDVLWIGCTSDEIHDIETIAKTLGPYMLYDADELVTNLYRDANT